MLNKSHKLQTKSSFKHGCPVGTTFKRACGAHMTNVIHITQKTAGGLLDIKITLKEKKITEGDSGFPFVLALLKKALDDLDTD